MFLLHSKYYIIIEVEIKIILTLCYNKTEIFGEEYPDSDFDYQEECNRK